MTIDASLLLDETALDLQSAVRDAVTGTGDWTSRLEAAETGSIDGRLWTILQDQLGVNALAVPEEFGGGGAGWAEVSVVLGELGRQCAAVPYLGTAVTTPALLLAAGDVTLLESAVAGRSSYALAVPATQAPWATAGDLQVTGSVATGRIPAVVDATRADALIVPAGDRLLAVDVEAIGVQRSLATSLDMTRPLCDVTLEAAPFTVVMESGGAEAVRAACFVSAALLASEQVGLAWTCLDLTVAYLKDRRQFGRIIGSYQALKHRLADLWVDLTQATAVARYAAVTADLDSMEFRVTAALAHVYCSEVAVRAAEEMTQLHGGIGFTWEHPAHLLLKRAKASALTYGTPYAHRKYLATVLAGAHV